MLSEYPEALPLGTEMATERTGLRWCEGSVEHHGSGWQARFLHRRQSRPPLGFLGAIEPRRDGALLDARRVRTNERIAGCALCVLSGIPMSPADLLWRTKRVIRQRARPEPVPQGGILTLPQGPTRDEAAQLRVLEAMNRARRHVGSGRHKRDRVVVDTFPVDKARRRRRPNGWYCIGEIADLAGKQHWHVWWQPTT